MPSLISGCVSCTIYTWAQSAKVVVYTMVVRARTRPVACLHHVTGNTMSRHGAAVGGTARVSALFTARFAACADPAGGDLSAFRVSRQSDVGIQMGNKTNNLC